MADKQQAGLARASQDPFALLRQMTSELDRVFDDWPSFRWPTFARRAEMEAWFPKIEVFEKDNRLVTRIDLPGMKKDDITVEARAGQLTLSGERKRETEEKKDNFYRSELVGVVIDRDMYIALATRDKRASEVMVPGVTRLYP